jgi:hypothetical protein
LSATFADDMRDSLRAMMEAEPFYSDVPIVTERLQDIDAKIDQLVGKAGGLCIVLVTPSFEGVLANLPGANFDGVRFVARTFEKVTRNETGKTALQVALYTAAFWSQLKPDEFSSPLRLDDPAVTLGNDPRFLTWDTNASTPGGTKIDIPRLDDLTIDASNLSAIVLAHPTPGVVMFYTLDGSIAAARNPGARLWTGNPFQGVPPTFNDGTRTYDYSVADQVYVLRGSTMNDPTFWYLTVYFDGDGNEVAAFYEIVDNANPGQWTFTRVAGAWQLTASTISGSTPPVIANNFSFFTGTTLRARAWLPGYIPSAEKRQTL